MAKLTVLKSQAKALTPKPANQLVGEGFDGLPVKKTSGKANPLSLRYLFVAPPKFGKTEFFMQFDDCLLLACEEGHKLVEGFKIIIDCYDFKGATKPPWEDEDGNTHMSFVQAISRIGSSNRYKFIIIDTVDALIKLITDYYELKSGVDHVSDLGDYGKGLDIGQNSPFRKAINQVIKTGRGIGFTTHQQVNTSTFAKGQRSKKETTLPAGIAKLIIPQVDAILHGKFGKIRPPNKFRDRIIITEGTEEILAGNRGGLLPTRYIVPKDLAKRGSQFAGFFSDPETVKVAEKEYAKHYEQGT